jgi:hypothetical protein
MKFLILFLLITPSLAFSQIDFGNQIKKKDMKDVSFYQGADSQGNTVYGFKIDDKFVGANLIMNKQTGINIFSNYNIKNEIDGTTIVLNQKTGEVELYTYRKNIKEGPAFQMTAKSVGWSNVFSKGEPTSKQYKVNHSFDYYLPRNYSTFEGFTYQKYKTSFAIGYFAYGKAAYPIVYIFDDGSSYYGQCIQGLRKEFGVYFYKDNSTYIGAWDKGSKNGLGFKVDSYGKITEKGFYDDGELVIKL